MLAVLTTFSLCSRWLGVAAVAVLLHSLLTRVRQHEQHLRRELQTRDEVIRERDLTITAYREVVALQMDDLESLSLPGPGGHRRKPRRSAALLARA